MKDDLAERLAQSQAGGVAAACSICRALIEAGTLTPNDLISAFEKTSKEMMQTEAGDLAHAFVDAVLTYLRGVPTSSSASPKSN